MGRMFNELNRVMYVIEDDDDDRYTPFVNIAMLWQYELIGKVIERHTSLHHKYMWSDFIAVCLDR